ncbi:hypothetical protein ACT4ZY_13730 [Acinetobacter baumannii]|nr:hypothetical protein [Acinetobacter baumannii]
MFMFLSNETMKKVSRTICRHNGWVSYQDHTFQCKSFERLEQGRGPIESEYRFDLTPCISCYEQGKECNISEIFRGFVSWLDAMPDIASNDSKNNSVNGWPIRNPEALSDALQALYRITYDELTDDIWQAIKLLQKAKEDAPK